MSKAKDKADEKAAELESSTPRARVVPDSDLLSTGCTLLNLALSGRPSGGVPKGGYLRLVGDSGAAKTWTLLNLFAEASISPHFKDYRFVFDDVENGALMDRERYFGKACATRMEPPAGTTDDPTHSATVQEFYYHLDAALDAGPCIYGLDSMDAINDEADEKIFEAERELHFDGTGKVPGSMGMQKAKTNARNINRVAHRLRDTGSILVIISQTRDKLNAQFPGQKSASGGRTLKFFAGAEVWMSVKAPITKTYLRKIREVGSTIRIDVQKNRVCGWEGKIEIPFLKRYGWDDIGALTDFLLDERHWGKPAERGGRIKGIDDDEGGSVFAAPEFDFVGRREALVKRIQDAGDEWELRQLAARVWHEIIAGAAPERKPRY